MSRRRTTRGNTGQLSLAEEGIQPEPLIAPATEATSRVARGVLRLVGRDEGVFEDIGLGDPRARKVKSLKRDILHAAGGIETIYRPVTKQDTSVDELLRAVLIVKETVGSNDAAIETYLLARAKDASGAEEGRPVQKVGALDRHSLGRLNNAFEFLPFKDDLVLISDENSNQIESIKQVYPSKIWEDADLSVLMLWIINRTYSGLDAIYGLGAKRADAGPMLQSPKSAIEFIASLQGRIDSRVIRYKSSSGIGRDIFMRNLTLEALRDRDSIFFSDKPPTGDLHSA